MQPSTRQSSPLALLVVLCVFSTAGCASLPDTDAILARHAMQAAQFETARGPVSVQKSAAIVAELKRTSGDIDILDKQIALEQALTDRPLMLGNKVTLLQDGPATYAAMLKAISGAQDHINMETYIIEDDAMGQAFAQALITKQRQGVQVNLIYDSVGSLATPKQFFNELAAAGVAVLEFNPVNPLQSRGGAWLLNNRDHRKLLIVDGRTVFLGGINISSVYSSGSIIHRATKLPVGDGAWRDTDLQIDGPVVADFQKLFMQTWDKQHGKTLMPKNYTPVLTAVGKDIVRAIGGTPDDAFNQVYLTMISAISNAERQVFLTNAYFVPNPQLIQALLDAVTRGVDVRLILPSYSDSGLVFHAGRAQYTQLLEGGVKIYERQGALLHAKTAMIDGVWSTVGSSNLDWRSFMDNDEVNAVILGRDFAQQMAAMFAIDQAASKLITPQSWADRPLQFKLKEWLARLWERWL
ncbi:cardiolipin synthase [Rhodoferax antarcticus]|uniref:Cardiolipin synthase n=1 Tax=Rhodoferax antarcticus ANT.BR TaxID=1111071 RepID=A0A1Q8YA18_9BURK|nr:cardiolipin synthase [Rhodoferax antarcticus]APW48411.1 cardiolipin synthase [Rhodoferax antarcticus]OLP04865.1 Cardiolipin synthetase [Rhodoferax antarcticus ANT.BR]